ncbi:MAG: hypothetical protein RL208_492 [Pseudomonadota bacterium]|jgi:hypothetical protein
MISQIRKFFESLISSVFFLTKVGMCVYFALFLIENVTVVQIHFPFFKKTLKTKLCYLILIAVLIIPLLNKISRLAFKIKSAVKKI